VSQACPYWLLTYAASNEIFPHDPTSDQWFSEAQFAAYTALGRVIANEAVKCMIELRVNHGGRFWVVGDGLHGNTAPTADNLTASSAGHSSQDA
jgi:hypothetical protein